MEHIWALRRYHSPRIEVIIYQKFELTDAADDAILFGEEGDYGEMFGDNRISALHPVPHWLWAGVSIRPGHAAINRRLRLQRDSAIIHAARGCAYYNVDMPDAEITEAEAVSCLNPVNPDLPNYSAGRPLEDDLTVVIVQL